MSDTFKTVPESAQEKTSSWLDTMLSSSRTKIALVTLFVSTMGGGTMQAQNTTSGEKSAKIEQITAIGNPQQDMESLLKKYNVPSVDDIWEMDFQDMANMRYDLTVLFGKNTTGAYHLDPHVIAVRDELIKNISVLLTTEEERLTFKKDAEKVIGRGITLDKGEKELAKNKQELAKDKQELAKDKQELAEMKKKLAEKEEIARQFGIIK